MKKYTLLLTLILCFGFSYSAMAQKTTTATSAQRLTSSATPAKLSLKDQIEQMENKLSIIRANPGKYSSEKLAMVESRLVELRKQEAEKKINGQYPAPQPETPWVQITKEEAQKLPEDTQKRVKVVFNKETGTRSQHFYIRSEY